MNRKVFVLAIAATFIAPMATYADVKLSGTIQAEGGGAAIGQVNGEEVNTTTLSTDSYGALANSGPNNIRLDADEKLGSGITAFAAYRVPFNTTTNGGLGAAGQEAYVGLKASVFKLRFGKLETAYKTSKGFLDPFGGTAIQARGTAGGMTGSSRLDIVVKDSKGDKYTLPKTALQANKVNSKYTVIDAKGNPVTLKDPVKGTTIVATEINLATDTVGTNHNSLAHSGEVNNALEIALQFGDFTATMFGVFDETTDMKSAGGLELKYSQKDLFSFFVAATGDELFDQDFGSNGLLNWKVGGQFKMAGLTLGLQYEDAELGAFDPNPSGGQYIMGSVDYMVGPVAIGGWVSQYSSDIQDGEKWVINNEQIGEDAMNWAAGIKYFFSKRTLFYAGYLQTDSDNDYRDQSLYGAGLRHSF